MPSTARNKTARKPDAKIAGKSPKSGSPAPSSPRRGNIGPTRRNGNITIEQPEGKAAAIWVPIGRIAPWAKNPRDNAKAVKPLANAIRDLDWSEVIVARREDGQVISGHTRLKAAIELGLEEVPVRFLDVSEAKAHLLALAANKLGEIAEWDPAELAGVLNDYTLEEALLAGFDEEELDKLAAGIIAGDGVEPGDAETDTLAPVWGVIVECGNEREQVMALEKLSAEGYRVRALVGG